MLASLYSIVLYCITFILLF